MVKTVKVVVKLYRDCNTKLYDSEHKTILDHYGEAFIIPGLCGDGYINATIDNQTGRIIGWKPITEEKLERMRIEIEEGG